MESWVILFKRCQYHINHDVCFFRKNLVQSYNTVYSVMTEFANDQFIARAAKIYSSLG